MREIKFRAWIPTGYDDDDNPTGFEMTEDLAFEEYLPINEHLKGFQSPLMQFTGLLDKNGKEIYEGDILYNPNYSMVSGSDRLPEKKIVVWHGDEAVFKLGFADPDVKNGGDWPSGYTFCKKNCANLFEVIGNIYENPDLLK